MTPKYKLGDRVNIKDPAPDAPEFGLLAGVVIDVPVLITRLVDNQFIYGFEYRVAPDQNVFPDEYYDTWCDDMRGNPKPIDVQQRVDEMYKLKSVTRHSVD